MLIVVANKATASKSEFLSYDSLKFNGVSTCSFVSVL